MRIWTEYAQYKNEYDNEVDEMIRKKIKNILIEFAYTEYIVVKLHVSEYIGYCPGHGQHWHISFCYCNVENRSEEML